jgi:hydroxypyruvate reductase
MIEPAQFLRSLFDVAVGAADPAVCVPPNLPERPKGRTVVVGAGKAAAAMARAVEDHWQGPLGGLVVTRYGHSVPTRRIEVVESGHPLPDAAGTGAAQRILESVRGLSADDLVLALISGGGSALMTLPAPGLSLDDKRAVTSALLKCGAAIGEINCVRKHLSAIKGGRLALAAAPARVVSLVISDVPGDDPSMVASGPTMADPTSSAAALAVIRKYGIAVPDAVLGHLADPASETPKPGDVRLARSEVRVIARARDALEAAAKVARDAGVEPVILGDAIEGEARVVAQDQALYARQHPLLASPIKGEGHEIGAANPSPLMGEGRVGVTLSPTVLISGGETTVTVRGTGRGGRNTEYLLALAIALDGDPGIDAIACGTDGIDGTEHNAGAILKPDSLVRARALGIDPAACLANNDAYSFFAALDDLVVTGPTRTNVNDFRAILIEP